MIELYNEDCLEGMKKISDSSVDLVLTDLPFGITAASWDKRIPFAPMWEQFNRVTKRNAAVVLFAQMPFGAELIMSNLKNFRYEIIWEKSVAVGFYNANKMPLRAHENILVFYRALPTYNPQFRDGKPYTKIQHTRSGEGVYHGYERIPTVNKGGRYPRDVQYFISMYGQRPLYHNTEKPVPLLEFLIKTYTDEGDVVLDATMGSGSTGVACVNTNRNFVGFELEEKFFDIARKRIDEAQNLREQSLFKLGVAT